MITRAPAFHYEGQAYPTLEAAQTAGLETILKDIPELQHSEMRIAVAKHLIKNGARVVDILTTTKRSKVRARSLHGGTRKRTKDKVTPMPSESQLPLSS